MKLTNPELIVKRSYKEVYKDGDKIVKIFEKDHPKSAVFNEALNTVRVEEAGLDIPKLDEVTQIDGKWALVIECQAGETLETVMEKDPDNLEKIYGRVRRSSASDSRKDGSDAYETERQTGKTDQSVKRTGCDPEI